MLNYATRLPPGAPVELLSNGMIRKKVTVYRPDTVILMGDLIRHFEDHPDKKVVRHTNFSFYQVSNKHYSSKYTYQYDMMRCGLLSVEERALVNLVGDNYVGKRFLDPSIFTENRKEFPKLCDFLQEVVSEGRYWDLHSGNIMLDEDWNYVIIDLEGFIVGSLGHPDNNWFRHVSTP